MNGGRYVLAPVAANDGANVTPLTDSLARLRCIVDSAVLPTGAATEATLLLLSGATGLDAAGARPLRAVQIEGRTAANGNSTPLYSAAGLAHTIPGVGTSYSSAALETNAVISVAACNIARVSMYSTAGTTRFALLFNALSLPGAGAVAVDGSSGIGTNARGTITYAIPNGRFSVGCTVASSSTGGNLTITAANDALFAVDVFPAAA